MSVNITIARPYAKAIFRVANSNHMLDEWEKLLFSLSLIVEQKDIEDFLKNKTISYSDKYSLIIDSLESHHSFDKNIQAMCVNFIKILSYYSRLLCFKDIYNLYKEYMNFELSRVEVVIKVASVISNEQKNVIIDSLANRFKKQIIALFVVDEGLLGGMVVKIGDDVLDASIIGNLMSLSASITI